MVQEIERIGKHKIAHNLQSVKPSANLMFEVTLIVNREFKPNIIDLNLCTINGKYLCAVGENFYHSLRCLFDLLLPNSVKILLGILNTEKIVRKHSWRHIILGPGLELQSLLYSEVQRLQKSQYTRSAETG